MILTIKFIRIGHKNQYIFRLIASDKHKNSKHKLGLYTPTETNVLTMSDKQINLLFELLQNGAKISINSFFIIKKLLAEKNLNSEQNKIFDNINLYCKKNINGRIFNK